MPTLLRIAITLIRTPLALPVFLFDALCYRIAILREPAGLHGRPPCLGKPASRDETFSVPANKDTPWRSEQHHQLSVMHRSLIVLRVPSNVQIANP